ncbi:carbohydrate-binding-like protein [Lactarius hatsudake]|nr:carbohydrate-binding-like protein [Lactarius hatsudake]
MSELHLHLDLRSTGYRDANSPATFWKARKIWSAVISTGHAPRAPRSGAKMFWWNWDGVAAECTNFLGPVDYGKDYGFAQGEHLRLLVASQVLIIPQCIPARWVTAGDERTENDRTGSGVVLFEEYATTTFEENVFVVGSVPGLGNWDPNNAIPLDPTNYLIWTATAYLPSDTEFEFSFIRKRSDGTIISEPGRPGVDRALASGIVLLFVGRCKKGHTPLFQLQGTSFPNFPVPLPPSSI